MDPTKTPGAFSWNELTTTDPAAAGQFYGKLFGWSVKDMGAAMGHYLMANVGEHGVAGIMSNPPDAPAMPPHWGSYVTVASVEQTLEKATSLGGKVLMPGMDIPGVGRMAVLQDPQGAVLSVMAYSEN
jgi:predicted enzyme related to lactoylglutathione lyase